MLVAYIVYCNSGTFDNPGLQCSFVVSCYWLRKLYSTLLAMATWRAASEAGKSAVKASTNLTGLFVAPNPHHLLAVFYGKTLRALSKMPTEYPYRKYTEQIVNERAALVKSITDVQELEKKIGCGQIEEVIIQAENELSLVRKLLEVKAWEPLATHPEENQWKWPL